MAGLKNPSNYPGEHPKSFSKKDLNCVVINPKRVPYVLTHSHVFTKLMDLSLACSKEPFINAAFLLSQYSIPRLLVEHEKNGKKLLFFNKIWKKGFLRFLEHIKHVGF